MMALAFTISRSATCRKCGALYEASEAQTRKRDFICKQCRYARDRDYREQRKAQGLRVSGRAMPLEYYRAYQADYKDRPEVKERRRVRARLRTQDPVEREKADARRRTRSAIQRGLLQPQPCEVCGEKTVDAHHDDYSQPLAVRWLCRFHHSQHHAKARGNPA